jgi:hypothetical protein
MQPEIKVFPRLRQPAGKGIAAEIPDPWKPGQNPMGFPCLRGGIGLQET